MRGRSWWLAAAILVALEGLAGCAGAPGRRDGEPTASGEAVCPEYRDLRCATPRECSMDRARGCLVCRCGAPAVAPWPAGQLPSGVSPDRRPQ